MSFNSILHSNIKAGYIIELDEYPGRPFLVNEARYGNDDVTRISGIFLHPEGQQEIAAEPVEFFLLDRQRVKVIVYGDYL